ncbi:hypothetical protein HOLleu_21603 [Holothuria leucospilota]|uniref:Uncharacterized protein n=1 Tax=Holothuria leucospilota TaxID=206669 RepID=A0A9Q1BY60_HOLLE|nr:hypothetical protein HOLleu_21603 [Holothuria leucospilota]
MISQAYHRQLKGIGFTCAHTRKARENFTLVMDIFTSFCKPVSHNWKKDRGRLDLNQLVGNWDVKPHLT